MTDLREGYRVRRTLFLLAFLPALTALAQAPTPPAPAGPTPPPPLPQAEIDALVEKLASDDPHVRETALRQLETAGPRAIAGLRKSLNHPDPEVRRVLVDLVPNLETTALLAPRRVTLKLDGKSVKDALDEVGRQTGYKVQVWGPNIQNAGLNFRLDDVPFWEAIDEISRQGGLALQMGYGDETVRLNAQEVQHPYVSRQGPFRVVANGMSQNRTIDLTVRPGQSDDPTRSTSLNLNLTLFAEPKLPIVAHGEPRLTHAFDTDRNAMLPVGNPEPEEAQLRGFAGRVARTSVNRYSQRMYSVGVSTGLVRPSERASAIKLLKGYVPVTVLVEQKAVEITKELDKANNLKAQVDTHTFTVQEVKEQPGGQWQVKMIVTQDTGENDYSWTNSLYQRIEVYGASGEKLQNYGSSWGNNGPNLVNMTLTFRNPAGKADKPQRLVFQSWTMLHTLAPFEFKDVPLP